MSVPQISLEQWAVFRAVVEEGSFAKAAERLNKSQSSVSYQLSQLEARLPSPVLEIVGRKAELTSAGKALYRQACQLLDQAVMIDRSAQYMAKGWEDELTIAVDALIAPSQLYRALDAFAKRCPMTRLRILETTLSGSEQAVLERSAQLAILALPPVGFLGESIGSVEMLPVASPAHALAKFDQISEQDLRQHRQIVIRDSGTKREQSAGWLLAEQRWTFSHFSSSIEAVKSGLGFAFLPNGRIQKELELGELKPLALDFGNKRTVPIHLVLVDQSYAGPAAKALAEEIKREGIAA